MLFFLLCALIVSNVCAQPVATSIPVTGVTSTPPPLLAASAGQVIATVSQITSFSFYVANLGASNVAGTATVAEWSTSTVVATVSITLPSATFSYELVTAYLNVENLDPSKEYVIYFTFPASSFSLYQVYTTSSSSTGGYVTRTDTSSSWVSGYSQNVDFDLETTSTLSLPNTNYAEGHGAYSWACIFHTVYTAVQVDWQNLIINTGYFANASSSLYKGPCDPALYWAPYGTAAGCGYENHYAHIDLTGTPYAVNESFVTEGYLANGNVAFSSNNQIVDLRGTGDCGFTVSATAWAHENETEATVTGGFHIHLVKIF